jgi:hypothetical protein
MLCRCRKSNQLLADASGRSAPSSSSPSSNTSARSAAAESPDPRQFATGRIRESDASRPLSPSASIGRSSRSPIVVVSRSVNLPGSRPASTPALEAHEGLLKAGYGRWGRGWLAVIERGRGEWLAIPHPTPKSKLRCQIVIAEAPSSAGRPSGARIDPVAASLRSFGPSSRTTAAVNGALTNESAVAPDAATPAPIVVPSAGRGQRSATPYFGENYFVVLL